MYFFTTVPNMFKSSFPVLTILAFFLVGICHAVAPANGEQQAPGGIITSEGQMQRCYEECVKDKTTQRAMLKCMQRNTVAMIYLVYKTSVVVCIAIAWKGNSRMGIVF